MSTSSLQRASAFAVVEELVNGDLLLPTSGTEFVPLRPGFTMSPSLEDLTSDEMVNDIGKTKSSIGIETVEGTHPAYFKSKGSSGFPNWEIILRSALGTKNQRTSTDLVVAGSTVTAVKVADASLYQVGQAVMINGEIRNIIALNTTTDVLTMNFAFTAVSTGDVIQKCYCVAPASSGHPSYSSTIYRASGTAIEAAAGCLTKQVTMTMEAGKQAEISFNFEGVKYYYNPITISASNKYLDIEDFNTDVVAAVLTEKIYRSPDELATEIAYQASLVTGEVISCSFSSSTGKFTIADAAGTFKLKWSTGANTANSVGTTIGFVVASDDTGAATYTSDNALAYSVPATPSYDSVDNITIKGAELFLGSSSDNFCRKTDKVTITLDTPVTNAASICSETGVLEKLILSRDVKLSCSVLLEKHEVALFTKFINSSTTQAMVNFGPLTNSLFTVGKSINVCLGNFVLKSYKISGDEILRIDLEGMGFVSSSSSLKDIYINFV